MSLNVLVVDDSPVMRKMVIRVLGMSGLPLMAPPIWMTFAMSSSVIVSM